MSGLFTSFEAYVVYAAAVLAALGYLLNKLRQFVRWFRRTKADAKTRIEKFNREWDVANAIIQYQLQHNDGHSLLDMAERIDSNHADAERHWKAMEARLSEIEHEMAVSGARLTAIEEGNERARQILDVAFKFAPIEQQRAVEEFVKKLPPPGPK